MSGTGKLTNSEIGARRDGPGFVPPMKADFQASITTAITLSLSEGRPNIESIARLTGFSVRTLQRKLRASGVTFSGLLKQARFDLAVEKLTSEDDKIIDIAIGLGYQDPSNFARAFRQVTGSSPYAYRADQGAR